MQPLPTFQPRGTHRPMTNAERQAEFRRRNPGYYGRLHAKRRAGVKARAAARAFAAEFAAELVKPMPLMLPAPVEMPVFPGMNTIPASMPARATVMAERSIAA